MSSGSPEAKACCSKEETIAVQASLIKGTEAASNSKPGYKAFTAPVKEWVSSSSKQAPTKAHSSTSDAPKTIESARHSKASSGLKSVYFKSLDLVTLLIATFTNTSTKRQDACKYVLDSRFKSLCNDASASGGLLFGPDLQKLLREVTENSKISTFAPGVLKNSLTLHSRRRGGGNFTRGQSYRRGNHGQLPHPSSALRGHRRFQNKGNAMPSDKRA
ncbi:hypothetical protein ElyMa_006925900 [Elysia marginata]|uniref:Uncharacterized protein n=1 Tax=Elysia marginata TaxID=1093978 RepID=A0AAV4JKF9_9GAST|nr:hypothetical protein ElyMa_006925900 [Elysia marginata]